MGWEYYLSTNHTQHFFTSGLILIIFFSSNLSTSLKDALIGGGDNFLGFGEGINF